MEKGSVQVICGPGFGKTTMALGKGVVAVTKHKKVIMIQFLEGSLSAEVSEGLKCLEPDMKVFRFEKQGDYFEKLSEEQKKEEKINIQNGLNFARKVLTTRECDLLILDEILGILDQDILALDEFEHLLSLRDEEMSLILTGKNFPDELTGYVDAISKIENVEIDNPAE